ncbi:MEDS domain-containing protein [Micromonospora radicis]|uniref:STAS domain-containing protein n=1 Tax=Micromonospora radicis TaxID=1894971 RepID=A0A418MSJ0_9ACTN|nr:MEDS domain-containing protein [Micromonospora radicis]RIV37062.1 STAS domain-containing protein [Micromonospora radicis]
MSDRPGPYGHVCRAYDDPAGFAAGAEEFLRAGLAAGERVWYVVAGPAEPVRERLRGVDLFAQALLSGAAEVRALDAAYTTGTVIDPAGQVAVYRAATRRALAAGYSGLRVAASCTDLVRTAPQRDAFARYEQRINRMMRSEAFRAMCGYHRPALGDQAVAELACLHPGHNVAGLRFGLYATAADAGHATLVGELDPANHELFRIALDRTELQPVDGELVLDASDLRFLDHRTLIHLSEHAQQRDARLVLRGCRAGTARLAALLDLPALNVEVTR